jgi:uncharacterized protein with von Willebrand factor type A (vWA) domain
MKEPEDEPVAQEQLVNELFKAALVASKASNQVQAGESYEYLESFPQWKSMELETSTRVAEILTQIQAHLGDLEDDQQSALSEAMAADPDFDAGDAALFFTFSETIERLLDEAEV